MGCHDCPPDSVQKTPVGYMADGGADGPAYRSLTKRICRSSGTRQPAVALPGAAAVAGGQQHAGAAGPKGIDPAADGPAGQRTDEGHRVQGAGHARLLQVPVLAGVVGVPDGAAVADGPALPLADKGQIVQLGVGPIGLSRHEDFRRRRLGGQRSGARRRLDGGWQHPAKAGCRRGHNRRGHKGAAGRRKRTVRHLDAVRPEGDRTLVGIDRAGNAGGAGRGRDRGGGLRDREACCPGKQKSGKRKAESGRGNAEC